MQNGPVAAHCPKWFCGLRSIGDNGDCTLWTVTVCWPHRRTDHGQGLFLERSPLGNVPRPSAHSAADLKRIDKTIPGKPRGHHMKVRCRPKVRAAHITLTMAMIQSFPIRKRKFITFKLARSQS